MFVREEAQPKAGLQTHWSLPHEVIFVFRLSSFPRVTEFSHVAIPHAAKPVGQPHGDRIHISPEFSHLAHRRDERREGISESCHEMWREKLGDDMKLLLFMGAEGEDCGKSAHI